MRLIVVPFVLALTACATLESEPFTVPQPAKVITPTVAPPAPAETVPVPSTPAPVPSTTPRTAAPPVSSPAPLFRDFVVRNDDNLLNVYIGMTKPEMLHIMAAHGTRWHNPYKHEVLMDRAGKTYEVFYYLTQDPEGKPVHDRHLTPVIVKEDTVVAIGAYRLKKLKRGESLDLPRQRASK